MHQFKSKDSEVRTDRMCLGNSSEDFSANNIKITGLNRCVNNCDFFVDYRAYDTSNIINIHKYLMKKHN